MKLSHHFFWQLTAAWCVSLLFFFLHFPNFSQTGLAEPRGGPGEKFNLQLEPDERFKLHTLGWRAFFLSGWDQQEARLYTDGEKINRSYATLHSGDNRVFTVKVSRRLFQSKQEFCGQRKGEGVWWAQVGSHLETQQERGQRTPGCMPAVCNSVFPIEEYFLLCLCRHSIFTRCILCIFVPLWLQYITACLCVCVCGGGDFLPSLMGHWFPLNAVTFEMKLPSKAAREFPPWEVMCRVCFASRGCTPTRENSVAR